MTDPQLLRLQDHLAKLKPFAIQARLDTLLQDASAQDVTYADFLLDRLLAEEVAAKSEKYVAMRTVVARFPSRNKPRHHFVGLCHSR